MHGVIAVGPLLLLNATYCIWGVVQFAFSYIITLFCFITVLKLFLMEVEKQLYFLFLQITVIAIALLIFKD